MINHPAYQLREEKRERLRKARIALEAASAQLHNALHQLTKLEQVYPAAHVELAIQETGRAVTIIDWKLA